MASTKRRLMILGAGPLQLPAIQRAKEMGLVVVAVDYNAQAVGFEYADNALVISTNDIEAVLAAARRHRIEGIMTLATDRPVRTVAAVVNEMGLPGISEHSALLTTNKAKMREALLQNNVPIPKFYECHSEEEFLAALDMIDTDCICKPVDSSGSRGVRLIERSSNMDELLENFRLSKRHSLCGGVIVEEFMVGTEVSVESISWKDEIHILAITDKLTSGSPAFVEMGHSQPSGQPNCIKQQVKEVARAALYAVGIQNSAAHTELIVTDEGPKIVEIGARMGGDNICSHLVPLSTGIDMIRCCIGLALGDEIKIDKKFDKGAAIRYLDSSDGMIVGIDGVAVAERIIGVESVHLIKRIGDHATHIANSSLDRIAYVIAQAETATDAVSICEQALRKIHISYK